MRGRTAAIRWTRALGLSVGVLALWSPAAASGALTCALDTGANELNVTNNQGGAFYAQVQGSTIEISDGVDAVSCSGGTPTTQNVDRITVTDIGVGTESNFSITAPALFAPGATDAGDHLLNPSEIEWTVDLGDGEDVLGYYASGDPGGARVTFGKDGINHNVSGLALANDMDVDVAGIDAFYFEGANDPDMASGQGGDGTGNPLKKPFDFFGISGLFGAGGDDTLKGGNGDDVLYGATNADVLSGGKGTDVALWKNSTVGVSVDIGGPAGEDGGLDDNSFEVPGERDTVKGNVEDLVGSDHADTLRGDKDDNVLTGGLGADSLFGFEGNDLLLAADGVADLKLKCGKGNGDDSEHDSGLDPNPKSC